VDQAAAEIEELEQSRLTLEQSTQKTIASYKAKKVKTSSAIRKLKAQRASLEK